MKHLPIDVYEQFRQFLDQQAMDAQYRLQQCDNRHDHDKAWAEAWGEKSAIFVVLEWLDQHAPDTADDTE